MSGILGVFEQRVRGVRLVELVGLVLCLGMMFALGWIKMKEDADVKRLEALKREIVAETEQVKALRAAVAHLEQPKRIEALASVYLGMKPVDSRHEANLDSLVEISRGQGAGVRGVERPASPVPPMPQAPSAVPVPTAAPDTLVIEHTQEGTR
ncbi:cell division protein FtsL [Asticcacaulis machinosus]|uniref:Septum formation inhibitor MinC n=1 Tax=Asticcacaulis machinosus TaxID=2984211 RepID=A0ABT5HHX1_9CAUL|nr:septum formation inhibitor MinC [Asticcacaulis machinosus]MDC7675845.1 septum formation inhibitor MinC [Asticcacaulis machinosus]